MLLLMQTRHKLYGSAAPR